MLLASSLLRTSILALNRASNVTGVPSNCAVPRITGMGGTLGRRIASPTVLTSATESIETTLSAVSAGPARFAGAWAHPAR